MVPMLDEAIELAAENGAHEVVIGMAHRGRLNVLAHTLGLGYDSIIREFEGERTIEAVVATDEGGTGDVKYHLGAEGTRSTPSGEITVTLAANPSHLEAVDPVVEGRARAEQTDRSTRYGLHDPSVALPILIHGDASFPGQGGVAETLNLSGARGLLRRRHAAPDREQPGRLHDGSERRTVDALLERPREGLRRADHPRQRRRSGGCDLGHPACARVPAPLRERRRRRPRRLPAPRPQRAGRGGVHAAADGRAGREPSDGARAVRATADRGRRRHRGRSERLRLRGHPGAEAGARGAQGDVRHAAASRGKDPVLERRGSRHRRPGRPAARAERGAPARPGALLAAPEAEGTARPPAADDRGGWDRLGPGRGARVRVTRRRGHPDPAHRSGHRARDVLASPRRAARREHGRDVHAAAEPRRAVRVVRDLQLAAVRVRVPRLRVRLLGRGAGGARPVGGAVRRLRQRRADRDRPVHRRGPVEVARDDEADAAAAARLRGERAGALQRAARALPAARGAGEHPRRELLHVGPVLPPCSAARRSTPPAGRSSS